ncbi:hypothetical protein ACFV3E_34965 [Streptomyces sp. NPDC059718]
MGQPDKETRRDADRDLEEEATRESETPSTDEEERGSEQLKIPPHEKRRGTGLEDF